MEEKVRIGGRVRNNGACLTYMCRPQNTHHHTPSSPTHLRHVLPAVALARWQQDQGAHLRQVHPALTQQQLHQVKPVAVQLRQLLKPTARHLESKGIREGG